MLSRPVRFLGLPFLALMTLQQVWGSSPLAATTAPGSGRVLPRGAAPAMDPMMILDPVVDLDGVTDLGPVSPTDPVQPSARTPDQEEENWEGDYLYRVALIRAAPGRLLDLIELLKEERDLLADIQEPLPFWMRHTQGDQWDLMILYPMGSFYEYFEPERTRRRNEYGVWKGLSYKQLQLEVGLLTSYREEVFVRGPDPEVLDAAFSHNGFYHAEMMVALPGRRARLLEERRMENRYLRYLGRPERLIFAREAGGPWDSFTLGFYRDLQHYAEAQELRADEEEMAARAAGFESAARIGSYMRSLILYHRDTLSVAIR